MRRRAALHRNAVHCSWCERNFRESNINTSKLTMLIRQDKSTDVASLLVNNHQWMQPASEWDS